MAPLRAFCRAAQRVLRRQPRERRPAPLPAAAGVGGADGRRGRGARAGGFTLIEVIVVLAILGLGLALLATRGPLRSAGADLRAATGEVSQALRLARARAMATDRAVIVALDPAASAFSVGGGAARPLPRGVALQATAVAGAAPGVAAIRFAPDGSASGGTVVLSAGSRRVAVAVDWLTGRVSVGEAVAP